MNIINWNFKLVLFIIALFIILSSCDNVNVYKPEEQTKNTTIAVLQEVAKDTVCFKKVQIENEIYLINPKTNLVEVKMIVDENPTATFWGFLLCGFLIFVMGFIVGIKLD